MAYTHVAHDVRIGSHVILVNGVTVGGHVSIGDWVEVSAFTGIHQFCRVGRHAIIGGYSVVVQDVMPFSNTVSERPIRVFGANRIGLERRGFSRETIEALQTALRLLTRAQLNTTQAIERIRAEVPPCAEIEELLEFIGSSERGVIKG
jgi:UDP-N-acetylglucosamine acyltransferase